MKLIIDIPEEIYQNAKTDMLCGSEVIVNAIKNGIPQEPQTDTWSIKDVAKALEKHGFGRLEQEPKTGHWIADEVQLPDRVVLNYHCSVCGRKLVGYSTETLKDAPYCHCGAKMEK